MKQGTEERYRRCSWWNFNSCESEIKKFDEPSKPASAMRPEYWGRIAMRPRYPGRIANSGGRKTHNSQKPSDKIFPRLLVHGDAARELAPHRESKADLDEPSSSLDSRCGARCRAASRCSLRKILSEGFWGTMCFPTARICDVAWVVGPHRDASPVLGTHRGGGFRWFIDFFYLGLTRVEIPPRAAAGRRCSS